MHSAMQRIARGLRTYRPDHRHSIAFAMGALATGAVAVGVLVVRTLAVSRLAVDRAVVK